jgi:hypothetical protein
MQTRWNICTPNGGHKLQFGEQWLMGLVLIQWMHMLCIHCPFQTNCTINPQTVYTSPINFYNYWHFFVNKADDSCNPDK